MACPKIAVFNCLTFMFVQVWIVHAKRGLVVTLPETWLPDREEKICVSFHNIDFDVATTSTITNDFNLETTQVLMTQKVNFNQGTDGCFSMMLPGDKVDSNFSPKFQFTADGSNYEFSQSVTLNVDKFTDMKVNMTFIELDKPMYKPGDEVKFRALTVDEELKPRLEAIKLIFVANPSGTRMMQWRNVDITQTQGIADLRLQLTPDTIYGTWKINVERQDGGKEQKSFEVQEYVLPKYEVTIEPPKYLPINVPTSEAEVCAKYTYGKPVKGELNVSLCMETPFYYYDRRQFECQTISTVINGCHKFDIPVHALLGDAHSNLHGLFIQMNATVAEEGTGVVLNTTSKTPALGFMSYDIKFFDVADTFKPGLPYNGKVKVLLPDGGPAVNKGVRLSRGTRVNNDQQYTDYRTDDSGRVNFVYTDLELDDKAEYVMLTARVLKEDELNTRFSDVMNEPSASTSLKSWYSPSESYLLIDEITENVVCGGEVLAHFVYTQGHNHEFRYKLSVQYSLLLEGEAHHSHGDGGVSVRISLPQGATGDAHLVVYYVKHDGEIVADDTSFKIGHCVKNNVEMRFSSPEVAPGTVLDLELEASPGSLCAYGVMDKSVLLLGGDNSVTMDQALGKVPHKMPQRGYSFMRHNDEYCINKLIEDEQKEEEEEKAQSNKRKPHKKNKNNRKKNRRPRDIMFPGGHSGAYSKYVDSSQAFKAPGMIVISDLTLETRPCEQDHYQYMYRPEGVFDSPPMVDFPMMGMPGPQAPEQFAPPARQPDLVLEEENIVAETDVKQKVVDTVRSFFPETWLWDLAPVGSDGTAQISQKAPDTITDWIGHAMCINQRDGLGISEQTSLKTFQPFFVSFTMPYSAIRGETLYMPVSVFNYLTECLVIELELKESDVYILEWGSSKTEICVCGQEKETHVFPITAVALGHVNVTVKASSVDNAMVCGNEVLSNQIGVQDTVIRELLVEPEGKEQEYAFTSFVCTSGEDKTLEAYLSLPEDLVPDSARGYVSVMGDVMGPVFDGLESLIRLPTGCGEQTMISFAPNVYILQYLTNTGQLNPDIQKKSLGYLKSGYQRELTYRHGDGSYSAWGGRDGTGSTWLTAFVLKSFSQAAAFIDIDEEDLRITRDWFQNNQLENGCFKNVGRVIHKSMTGGLSAEDSGYGALTAYILGALLESGYDSQDGMVSAAVRCIHAQTFSDPYTTALVSYALSMWDMDHELTRSYMDRLEAMRIEQDEMFHWKSAPRDASTYENNSPRPADVETTAYALMAYINAASNPLGELDTILPIVNWLNSQRNPGGGFLSTQDTVVALQSLAKFAEIMATDTGELTVQVTPSATNEAMTYNVNNGNKLVLQKDAIPVPTNVTFRLSGEGCALVQASMKYNILNVTSGSKPSVYIDVRPSRTEDNNCRLRDLKICIRYEGPDDQTNMAMLDVKMVTGWVPVKESIDMLMQDSTLGLAKYELEKKNAYFYFDELRRGNLVCLTFTVEEEVEVRKAKPGTVAVYDYYDMAEVYFEKPYELKSICGTKEELPFNKDEQPFDPNHIEQVRQPWEPVAEVQPEETVCSECFEENFDTNVLKDLLCSAKHVYKAMVRKPLQLKVNKDQVISGSRGKLNMAVKVKEMADCTCNLLQTRTNYVWIVTQSTEIVETSTKKGSLKLMEEDKIIPVPQKSRTLDRLLKKVKKSKKCKKLNIKNP